MQDTWADPSRRATRVVEFDREHDCLTPGCGDALREVFERHRPRHDRATRPVLGNPFHAYGAGPEYEVAAALSLTDERERAAEAWAVVAATLDRRDDVPLGLRISLLERRVVAERSALSANLT